MEFLVIVEQRAHVFILNSESHRLLATQMTAFINETRVGSLGKDSAPATGWLKDPDEDGAAEPSNPRTKEDKHGDVG